MNEYSLSKETERKVISAQFVVATLTHLNEWTYAEPTGYIGKAQETARGIARNGGHCIIFRQIEEYSPGEPVRRETRVKA